MSKTPGVGLSALRYTTLRLALFIVWAVALYFVGVRDVFLVLLAFGGSGITSLWVLRRQRDAMSAGLDGVFKRINRRIEESKTAEDQD